MAAAARRFRTNFEATVSAADLVLCGNRHLAGRLPHERFELLPTPIDGDRFAPGAVAAISSVGISATTVLPAGAVTLPATYVVFAGMSSTNLAPLTLKPVSLRITTLYSKMSPGSMLPLF